MARALRAWAINRGGKNSVRNLRYGPRTRLVRGIYPKQFSYHDGVFEARSVVQWWLIFFVNEFTQ